ncbi:MAG: lipopolysaccharide transport periplasmic protein LptA [Proteobacteria bacterium]|nr:lipopolysaccharide transport periplasmic protein LptA [Pseudomonadota bacterium]
MSTLRSRSLLVFYLIPILALSVPLISWAQDKVGGTGKLPGQSIVINSDSIEIDNKRKTVVFTGNVDAKREDLFITCERMVLYYHERPTDKTLNKNELKIDKIIATGGVKITRPEGGLATAEQATYYQDGEKVVLTGKPKVTQGNDFVEGTIITLFLRENRSTVEGSGDQKVRAIITPRDVKR